MAFWDKIGSVGDIEDRRGTAAAVGGYKTGYFSRCKA